MTKIFNAEVPEIVTSKTASLYLNVEFGFGMKIRFYKKHLDMMITKTDGLTGEADGLMGRCKIGYLFFYID